ncbi:MAG: bifunctional metallophosphatase/5'-nucleotidase [Gemmatimonadota bacterium]
MKGWMWGGVLLAAAAGCGLPAPPPPTNPMRFLLVNDVYVLDTLADGTGGLARVASIRKRIASEGPTLFVLAGDVLSPSLLSKYYSGRQMVEAFNAAGLDYATFGNHEFELARDTLVARIGESKFKWLSANCTEAGGTAFPGVLPWDTVRMHGRLVGLFGLTMPGRYRSYVQCTDPDSAAARAIDALDRIGASFIIGLTHQSIGADRALLRREPELNLILGGHEHHAISEAADARHILKADANGRSVQFVTVWGGEGAWRQAVNLIRVDAATRPDTAVLRITAAWQDSLRRRLGPEQVVGQAGEPVDARDAVSRQGESAIGRLVTDAMRSGTGADVALLNSGTLRLDDVVPAGPVTNYTIESLFLFPDEARTVTFPLTGARLRAVLEHGVSDRSLGAGPFLQVSGISFTYDPSRPEGSRIVGDIRRAGSGVIGPDDTVRVAFGVYPACEGGDGYRIPEAAEACRTWEQAPRAADLVIRHVREGLNGQVTAPPPGRIIRQGS